MISKSLKINHCTDIFLLDYPRHEFLKEEIGGYLETFVDVQNKKTAVQATMTNWGIVSKEILNLKTYIIDFLNQTYPFVSDRKQRFVFQNLWGNIYRENEFTVEHDHLFTIFSVVYFLKSKPNYSPLTFYNSSCEIEPVDIDPKEGTFTIFPSYLKHKVKKHKSKDGSRITLAGNIICAYDDK